MTASEMFGVPVEGHAGRRCAAAPRRSISASSTASRPSASPTSSASRARRPANTSSAISSASPASRTTWRRCGRRCAPTAIVSTLFGRKIHFAAANARNPAERAFIDRAAINAPIQGSAADIIRRAMIRMEPALRKARLSAAMLLQVHDELIFEVPESEVEETIAGRRPRHGGRRRAGGAAIRAAAGRRPGRRQLGRRALAAALARISSGVMAGLVRPSTSSAMAGPPLSPAFVIAALDAAIPFH